MGTVKEVFDTCKLERLDWKLSLATSSNYCKNLNAPIVTLSLTLKDRADELQKKTMELTMPEFQVSEWHRQDFINTSLVLIVLSRFELMTLVICASQDKCEISRMKGFHLN